MCFGVCPVGNISHPDEKWMLSSGPITTLVIPLRIALNIENFPENPSNCVRDFNHSH